MERMTMADQAAPIHDQHSRLGRTGWLLWRDAAVRSAGFPARRILDLCDDELAAAADKLDEDVPTTIEGYVAACQAAEQRLTAAIRATAAEPRFREAVTWQNPALVHYCLDKAVAGERRNARGRYYELTITSYLQRYCLKNDTVGFFGPLGWARIVDDETGLSVRPGPEPLARRSTYFEGWAIDAVAETLVARPDVWPWLRPRAAPSAAIIGSELHLPLRPRIVVSAQDIQVLRQCDGTRTVREIVGDPPDPRLLSTLVRLRDSGAVLVGLAGTLVARPEAPLSEWVDSIGDPQVRASAGEPLHDLIAAREQVSAAAGDPDRLLQASASLARKFEEITGASSSRRAGSTYAGRTLVYEDTVLGTDVRLGGGVIGELAEPLGLVLDSALWLANAIGQAYRDRARQFAAAEMARSGRRTTPFIPLLLALMPEYSDAMAGGRQAVNTVEPVVAEFQQRWRRVLDRPAESGSEAGPRQLRVEPAAVAGRVAREFSTSGPLWTGARWHSPDVMLYSSGAAGDDVDDLRFVLGELHCGCNSLESQVFASQHPDPSRLRDAAAASGLGQRIVMIQRTDGAAVTSRMSRADEIMLPSYTYLCLGEEGLIPPPGATTLPVTDLVVQVSGEDLTVRQLSTGRRLEFLDVISEPLAVMVADAFRPFGDRRHCPRISIGKLVIARESWTFPAAELEWAFTTDERRRYLLARRWRTAHDLPERGFVRVPVERKPVAVDFRSLALVNLLAKAIRKTAQEAAGDVTLSEMLPDLGELWLRDAAGEEHTSEFRVVAVLGSDGRVLCTA
jgi:Lantibiotic dehydratase, N terminus